MADETNDAERGHGLMGAREELAAIRDREWKATEGPWARVMTSRKKRAELAPEVTAAVRREWRPADDFSPVVQRAAASMYIPGRPADEAREWLHGRQLNAAQSVLAAALDVEEMARVLGQHRIECTGLEGVTCRGCRERGWMSRYAFEQHQVTALRAAILGGAA